MPASAALPSRVREAIRRQQDQTERLIGWIQLAVVVTFGVLYFLSPKTVMSSLASITGWAIGIYFILTLTRLALAYLIHLPGWILALSVLVDMALLFGLIWSFHLQYDQPAAFYLKAPTLLYVFIFIALRALRLEAGLVVLAGLAAALGWAAMLVYALVFDEPPGIVTRDYVRYLTSNSVLIGAEFDKIVSMLVVTAIIAAALVRGRRLLERSVSEGFARQDLSRFFSPEIARRITEGGGDIVAGAGEARDAAILNIDIRGFTALAGVLPPDEVMKILADYQARLVPVIQQHGGTIDKFLGDGIMATFGAAQPSPAYAADALRALDEIMARSTAWERAFAGIGPKPLRINGAVATGSILCGAVGHQSRLEYTVIGDAVNLSAKLEKHNKALGSRALVTAAAYDTAVAQGYAPPAARRRIAASAVPGVETPVDLVVAAA